MQLKSWFFTALTMASVAAAPQGTRPTGGDSGGNSNGPPNSGQTSFAPPSVDENRVAPNNASYNNLPLIARLLTLPLQADRVALLEDGDFVFDFIKIPGESGLTSGNAGRTVAANRKTMPALIGTGAGMTMGFLGPCGFNTPHVHPRGTELNVPVVGRLVTTMILENNVKAIHNVVNTYQMHVFPQGALHQEFNPDCTETIFVAAFNNEDFGTGQIMDNYFKLNNDVIAAGLGIGGDPSGLMIDGRNIDQFKTSIPKNVAIGVESCLQKCRLTKRKIK